MDGIIDDGTLVCAGRWVGGWVGCVCACMRWWVESSVRVADKGWGESWAIEDLRLQQRVAPRVPATSPPPPQHTHKLLRAPPPPPFKVWGTGLADWLPVRNVRTLVAQIRTPESEPAGGRG